MRPCLLRAFSRPVRAKGLSAYRIPPRRPRTACPMARYALRPRNWRLHLAATAAEPAARLPNLAGKVSNACHDTQTWEGGPVGARGGGISFSSASHQLHSLLALGSAALAIQLKTAATCARHPCPKPFHLNIAATPGTQKLSTCQKDAKAASNELARLSPSAAFTASASSSRKHTPLAQLIQMDI